MPLGYFPRAGEVLVCDFTSFQIPEMTKVRPVVVISPRLPYRSEIVTIVPLSTTAPKHDLPFVVRLSKNYHPLEADNLPTWAKCDMLTNLGLHRLNRFKVGRRKWEAPIMTEADLAAIRKGVIHGLGLSHLIDSPESTK
jgi:mRNA interferase MazF